MTHTRACATARLVFPQSLPALPGLTNSEAHNHGVNIIQAAYRLDWEVNKHNSIKSITSFTFVQVDSKQRSAACPWSGWTLTHPPTPTHCLLEVDLDKQKPFCFRGNCTKKSFYRAREKILKHSNPFTSNHDNLVKENFFCHTCSKGKEEALVCVLP